MPVVVVAMVPPPPPPLRLLRCWVVRGRGGRPIAAAAITTPDPVVHLPLPAFVLWDVRVCREGGGSVDACGHPKRVRCIATGAACLAINEGQQSRPHASHPKPAARVPEHAHAQIQGKKREMMTRRRHDACVVRCCLGSVVVRPDNNKKKTQGSTPGAHELQRQASKPHRSGSIYL